MKSIDWLALTRHKDVESSWYRCGGCFRLRVF